MSEHGHHHNANDRIEHYQRINVGDAIVQIGVCANCHEIVARRYVITGPGTGPWTILRSAAHEEKS